MRPYPDPLRARVFGLLAELMIHVHAPEALRVGVDNADAIRYVVAHGPKLLLVPFHVVREASGERTSGLELTFALRRAHPPFERVPVVMPVSIFAQVAFEAAWRDRHLAYVFPLLESQLDGEKTREALRAFLITAT